jgi:hypothetical protein
MKTLRVAAILAVLGFGGGLLSNAPSTLIFSRPGLQAPATPAVIVPLMANYENRSANPDGSGVFSVSYMIAVRKDGSRAQISTDQFGKGWLKTRTVYDPTSRVRVTIHDDVGIKTTWPNQSSDLKGIIAQGCTALAGSKTVNILGYTAVQVSHSVDPMDGQVIVLDSWRIPELGCLRALTTFQVKNENGASARNGEDRLVWLSETDPPNSFFEVSPQLEEVSPLESYQRYTKAGLWSESDPVPFGVEQGDVAYAYWNGRIDRAQATKSVQQLDANRDPERP